MGKTKTPGGRQGNLVNALNVEWKRLVEGHQEAVRRWRPPRGA